MKRAIKIISLITALIMITAINLSSVGYASTNKININDKLVGNYIPQNVITDTGVVYDLDDYILSPSCRKYFTNIDNAVSTFSAVNYDEEELKPNKTVTALATRAYDINIPTSSVIQKCYVGIKYLYVVYLDGKDVILCRCKINNEEKTANYMDKMVLKNFGHDQSLEFYNHNDKTYIWIGCRANPDYPESHYSSMIGRIQYKANTVINNYTDICSIGSLNCGNTTGIPFDILNEYDRENYTHVVKRIELALSYDRSKLCVATWSIYDNIQYSYFDNEKINNLLDKVENNDIKNISCAGNKDVKNACLFSCVQKYGSRVMPNNVCQGIDFANDCSIYMSGGVGEKSYLGYVMYPKIAKMIRNSSGYTYVCCVKLLNTIKTEHPEIEGVQLAGNTLYFVLDTVSAGSNHYVFSLDTSVFN